MNRRPYLHVSLRAVLLLITIICIGTALGVRVYEERYARNRRAHQYFRSLEIGVVVGDPCPPRFVYYLDGTCRHDGINVTDTPDWLDRLFACKLSYPAVRELNFRNRSQNDYRFQFNLELADQVHRLAPDVEFLQLPHLPDLWKDSDRGTVDSMVDRITMLKHLRVVSFVQWPVTDDHMNQLVVLEQLQAVQIGHSSRVTDRAFESFRKMKNLRFLTIYDGVSDQAAQQFHKDRPEVIMHVRGVNYGDHSQLYMNRKRNASGS